MVCWFTILFILTWRLKYSLEKREMQNKERVDFEIGDLGFCYTLVLEIKENIISICFVFLFCFVFLVTKTFKRFLDLFFSIHELLLLIRIDENI